MEEITFGSPFVAALVLQQVISSSYLREADISR